MAERSPLQAHSVRLDDDTLRRAKALALKLHLQHLPDMPLRDFASGGISAVLRLAIAVGLDSLEANQKAAQKTPPRPRRLKP